MKELRVWYILELSNEGVSCVCRDYTEVLERGRKRIGSEVMNVAVTE